MKKWLIGFGRVIVTVLRRFKTLLITLILWCVPIATLYISTICNAFLVPNVRASLEEIPPALSNVFFVLWNAVRAISEPISTVLPMLSLNSVTARRSGVSIDQTPKLEIVQDTLYSIQEYRTILSNQMEAWQLMISLFLVPALLITILTVMIWRFRCRRVVRLSVDAFRARRAWRLSMVFLFLINGLSGLALYVLGTSTLPVFSLLNMPYLLAIISNLLIAELTVRLLAPPTLSGRHCYFKHL